MTLSIEKGRKIGVNVMYRQGMLNCNIGEGNARIEFLGGECIN